MGVVVPILGSYAAGGTSGGGGGAPGDPAIWSIVGGGEQAWATSPRAFSVSGAYGIGDLAFVTIYTNSGLLSSTTVVDDAGNTWAKLFASVNDFQVWWTRIGSVPTSVTLTDSGAGINTYVLFSKAQHAITSGSPIIDNQEAGSVSGINVNVGYDRDLLVVFVFNVGSLSPDITDVLVDGSDIGVAFTISGLLTCASKQAIGGSGHTTTWTYASSPGFLPDAFSVRIQSAP